VVAWFAWFAWFAWLRGLRGGCLAPGEVTRPCFHRTSNLAENLVPIRDTPRDSPAFEMGPQGRKARSKHSHTSFTKDDVWEMIAYLDYCLMFSPDQRSCDTITVHLKAYTSKTFTPEQVDRKIQRLWRVEGIEGADQCDYRSIYHHGSKVLRCAQEDLELKAKIQARTMEIKDLMIEKLWKENRCYRQEVKRLSEVKADLDRKRRASLAAQSILSKDPHTSEQCLAKCLSEIYNLESQVNNKEVLLPFTKSGGKRLDGLQRPEIVTDLTLIERYLSSVLVFPETKSIRTDFDLQDDQQSDLSALSRRIFGGSMRVLQHAQFRHIFRSLVSAAVGMWVFESDFDDPYLASSNLREVMLSHLRTQGMSILIHSQKQMSYVNIDGEDVARNLDFAAHHTLINNEYFQRDIIPMRAAELAKRLRLALDPVLEAEKAYSGWRTDISNLWKPRLAALKYIFEFALRIKTKVLVTQDMFEIVLPAHGDSYDERLMQVENGLPANESSRVLLAVAPGLQRFEYNRQMVDYNSFRLPVPMSNLGFDVMQRAMVVLDPHPSPSHWEY
jgi:hypothetical protein